MYRNISILAFVVLGLCEFGVVLALLAIGVLGVVEEPQATSIVKQLFILGAVLIVPFLLTRLLIKCDSCSKSLVTFNNFDNKSVSWDSLLWSLVTKEAIKCPHCRQPNHLRKNSKQSKGSKK